MAPAHRAGSWRMLSSQVPAGRLLAVGKAPALESVHRCVLRESRDRVGVPTKAPRGQGSASLWWFTKQAMGELPAKQQQREQDASVGLGRGGGGGARKAFFFPLGK